MSGVIMSHDWTRQASIFGDSEFEIYNNTTRTNDIKKVHNVIGGHARYMLETRKILDDIKSWFFELYKLTAGFIPEQKD